MKLSEAIRLGAMMNPQCFNARRGDDGRSSCALGSALDAIGKPEAHYMDVINFWPESQFDVIDPIESKPMMLLSVIRSLNDVPNCWTRERIADWVETVETAQEAKQPEPEMAATK